MKRLIKGAIKTYVCITSIYFTIAFSAAVVSVNKKNKQHKQMLDYVEDNKNKIKTMGDLKKAMEEMLDMEDKQ